MPPRFHKGFAASVKLTFTPDGAKDIPVIRGSNFNIIVTNTEKIRIQKSTVRAASGWTQLQLQEKEKQLTEEANLRLQTIASLPHLAVFFDEAHHTYGQAMGKELKKVRQTVDYLHHNSPNLICVVNTTGTPYYERQPLKDVVTWYGLSQGIGDRILKEVSGNIHTYTFTEDNADKFIADVVKDFFKVYADITLPNGAPAKLAIYFPQTDDLEELRPAIEAALTLAGQSPTIVLRNTSDSTKQEIDAFNRLNDPHSPHRVILLVNKGTEGWNCPSLFACALARKLKNSNNFVLQAATRCLREIPGNNAKASIYLSRDNRDVLDKQLQETYGESLSDLNRTGTETESVTLRVRKINPPPVVIRQTLRTVLRDDTAYDSLIRFERPTIAADTVTLQRYAMKQHGTAQVLQQVGQSVIIDTPPDTEDLHTAAVRLAEWYRLDLWMIHGELTRLYGDTGEMPLAHLPDLSRQIEQQVCRYRVEETVVEKALALVKPEGFIANEAEDGQVVYTAEIRIPKTDKHLLAARTAADSGFGYHYDPYNFDSAPEKSFYLDYLLPHVNLHPDNVEDIYFTGGLTDPAKTEFFVEYKDEKGHWRNYFPDFLIRLKSIAGKPGKCLIVEIKDARWRAVVTTELEKRSAVSNEGRKAMAITRWTDLDPERLKYQIIFADPVMPTEDLDKVKAFVTEGP